MLDLWLVRHAESVGNLDGTEADTELSPRGREQALGLATTLEDFEFDLVIVSPLRRARETAALALPRHVPTVDERLVELRSGPAVQFFDTSLLAPEHLHRVVPKAAEHEESGAAFMARVRAWIADLPAHGRVVAITHFAVVREIASVFLGFRNAPQSIAHASVVRIEIEPGGAGIARRLGCP
jgi:alpha-ribazole phosphatase